LDNASDGQKSERVVYLVPEVSLTGFKKRAGPCGLMPFIESGKLLVRTLSSVEDIPLSDERIRRAASGAHVFLDTCTRFFDGDEQSAQDAKKFAATLFALQRAGARTLTGAHHSPKAFGVADSISLEAVLRGSGDLGAMLSTCWAVRQTDPKLNKIYVKNVKPRDFEPVEPFEIVGRPWIDKEGCFHMSHMPGMAVRTNAPKPDSDELMAARVLKATGIPNREIAEQVGVTIRCVQKWEAANKLRPKANGSTGEFQTPNPD